MIAKEKTKTSEPQKVIFSDKPNFWVSYIIGILVGIAGFALAYADALAWLILLLVIIVVAYIAKTSIDKNKKEGHYSLFVGSVMAIGGLIFGSLLIWASQKYEKVFKYSIPIIIGAIALVFLILVVI